MSRINLCRHTDKGQTSSHRGWSIRSNNLYGSPVSELNRVVQNLPLGASFELSEMSLLSGAMQLAGAQPTKHRLPFRNTSPASLSPTVIMILPSTNAGPSIIPSRLSAKSFFT